jgi:hypothetical protein
MVSPAVAPPKSALAQRRHQMTERRELSPQVDPFRQNLDLALKEIEAQPELINREELMQALVDTLAQAELPGAV